MDIYPKTAANVCENELKTSFIAQNGAICEYLEASKTVLCFYMASQQSSL